MTSTETGPIIYDPDDDNCGRGGCSRNDPRRVYFNYFGLQWACVGCYEAIFAAKVHPGQTVITLTPEQMAADRVTVSEPSSAGA